MGKITINDLAEMAQVSKSTVSKALSGAPGVGGGTRERIIKLAKKLEYEPDSTAQSLVNKKTGNIGLIIPHEASAGMRAGYWSTLITEIAHHASLHDYYLLILTAKKEGDIENVYHNVLKSRRVDGLIIGSELLDRHSISSLMVQDIPFVLIGKNSQVRHYAVDIDNRHGAALMTNYMIKKGYKKIVMLAGPEDYEYNRERARGFTDGMKQAGLHEENVFFGRYTRESVEKTIPLIMKEKDPDCLFIGSGGEYLFDCLDVLNRYSLKYPDFGVGVFDDYRYLDHISPRVTAVAQPLEEMGVRATDMLFKLINQEEPAELELELKTSIVPRFSLREGWDTAAINE